MIQRIRLTEGDLHRIIRNCIDEALNEIGDTERGQYALGCVAARNDMRQRQNYNNGNYEGARKNSKISGNADNIATQSRKDANGGSEFNQDNMNNYYKVKDMYNANQQGYRNYMSSMNGADNGDYRKMQIKH